MTTRSLYRKLPGYTFVTSSSMHEAVVSYETILLCVLWHKYIEEPPLLLFCKPLGYDGAYNHAA